jgi:hypothetical protein
MLSGLDTCKIVRERETLPIFQATRWVAAWNRRFQRVGNHILSFIQNRFQVR